MTPDANADDRTLIQAAVAGDQAAFALLVTRYAPSVMSVTTRMLGHAADAQDVAQDTFVSAYKALPKFEFGAKFSTWLYRIAVNKCKDWLRSRHRWTVSLDTEDEEGQPLWEAVDDRTPQWDLEQMELARALDAGIHALPPLYRESFVLKHVEGLDYEQMSEVLGVHRDTLKMRVYKARTMLCRSLAHFHEDHH